LSGPFITGPCRLYPFALIENKNLPLGFTLIEPSFARRQRTQAARLRRRHRHLLNPRTSISVFVLISVLVTVRA
jgi:hypothetical protein